MARATIVYVLLFTETSPVNLSALGISIEAKDFAIRIPLPGLKLETSSASDVQANIVSGNTSHGTIPHQFLGSPITSSIRTTCHPRSGVSNHPPSDKPKFPPVPQHQQQFRVYALASLRNADNNGNDNDNDDDDSGDRQRAISQARARRRRTGSRILGTVRKATPLRGRKTRRLKSQWS